MALPESEIRRRSTHLRYTLGPAVCRLGEKVCNREQVADIRVFLINLEKTVLDLDTVRRTRIDKALIEMSDPAMGWPMSLAELSSRILETWEKRLGDVRDLRAPLWDKGGRMEGCYKTRVLKGYKAGKTYEITSTRKWVVEVPRQRHVQRYVHRRFEVGQ